MVKVAGPALSLDASGSIAGSMVFSKWKGRNYVRSLVTPANPKSGPQTGLRATFKFLSQNWAALSAGNKATWLTNATAKAVSTFNEYMQFNQSRARNFLGITAAYPPALVSTACTAPTTTVTAGVRQLSLAITKGANPATWGWMIFRSTVTGFTPAFSNMVAAVLIDGSGNGAYVDTPLAAGTYYYRVKGFNLDAVLGNLEAEKSGTVT
jgi:hypothetical protein